MNPVGVFQRGAQLPPPAAREALQRAAQTPIPDDDPLARVKAIDQCIQRLRRQYPEFFRKDAP